MRLKNGLSYLLLISIVLQSMAAFAEIHQIFQPGENHFSLLQVDDDFKLKNKAHQDKIKQGEKPAQSFFEFDHGCHFHGSDVHYLNIISFNINHSKISPVNFYFLNENKTSQLSTLYRPPKTII
jgi:hypothetical protein